MEQKIKYITLAALICTALLMVFPVRSLLADGYHRRGLALIKADPERGRDEAAISGKTVQNYLKAIADFETAAALVPSQSVYPKAYAELYLRLGIWAGAMEGMHAPLPAGALSSKEAYGKALAGLNAAAALEPSNPDIHFALGCLHDLMDKNSGLAEKQLARAVAAYPVNAPLRYAVAVEHLKSGRTGDALEQARALAKIAGTREYLMGAFDIAWRTTGDPEVVRGMAPDTAEADKAVAAFFKARGIGWNKQGEKRD